MTEDYADCFGGSYRWRDNAFVFIELKENMIIGVQQPLTFFPTLPFVSFEMIPEEPSFVDLSADVMLDTEGGEVGIPETESVILDL